MKYDERLSNTLHAMLHMAHHGRSMTSEVLAVCLHTNPVVVRRTMAGLREAGLVTSARGHGGGWIMARDLESITLLEVHTALGGSALLAPPTLSDNAGCLVEAAVKDALAGAHAAANALLAERLAHVTLADLAKDFTRRMAECASRGDLHAPHTLP